MKSYGKPTNKALEQALALLSSPQHIEYFFSRLENPSWIGPLLQRGVFKDPPRADHVNGGGVRFPRWPAGSYLARMAAAAPAEVAAIFANIETDNPSVIGNILKAALVMPPVDAKSLVPVICRAAKKRELWIYFKDASDFCVRLAKGEHPEAAMKLAKALFTPRFKNGAERRGEEDQLWYRDGLKKVVPALAGRKPDELLRTLSDWLKASVDAKNLSDKHADYSYLWRAAVEEHEQNREYDFAGAMVGFVREGFELSIRSGSFSLHAAIAILEGYLHLIFKRIRVHLIAEFGDQYPELARQTILNREIFDDYQFKHEYAMLVGRRFNLLLPLERDEWFSWIDAGPDMTDFDRSENLGRGAPTAEDRKTWIQGWQVKKLHWARSHLDGARRDFYAKMISEHGVPDLAEFTARFRSEWVHDGSPMTVEQLGTMTFEQAVVAVSSWRPESSRFGDPSITGLASTFEKFVATSLEEYSAKARLLINQPAIFVRGFLNQMSDAIKSGRHVDLSATLDLCDWVLKHPMEGRNTWQLMYDDGPVDRAWQWTREQISGLMETICTALNGNESRYALNGLRHRVWQLIASLCHDSAESCIVRDISKEDPRVHDYLDLGINSRRGSAVEAALEYARWVANHIKISEGKQEIVPGGFDAMPEVREMLEWQIAPENRSFEALAVIGSRLGLVYWIDKQWLALKSDELFRLEDIETGPTGAHGWAAWNAFLIWVRPHFEFYQIFKSQFANAVKHAATVKLPEFNRQQPMYAVGEHLLILYVRGQLGMDDDEALLRQFLKNANPDIRRHAISFLGRSLDGDEIIPGEMIKRFQTLWDLYWDGPGMKDAEESPKEWLFGTWFSCGKFPESWALERLQHFVEVNPTPEPDHLILQRLAKIAHVDIARSVCILDKLVRGDQEGWRVHGWLDAANQILRAALRTSGAARGIAERLIDYLGRRGYLDFGSLLREVPR
jgi:hypothetical protein